MSRTLGNERNDAGIPPPLSQAIDAVYAAFRGHRAPTGTLDVCLHCCMDPVTEQEMRRLPLRQLNAHHFYAYNDSAKSSEQPEEELLYLLPRMLELLALGARLHHSTELYLDRVGRCKPGSFTAKEHKALQDFALAYFTLGLEHWGRASKGIFQNEDAFTILLMWDYAGVDLAPLLDTWARCESTSSTLHYVDACYWKYLMNGNQISNAFASERTHYRATLEQWLTASANRDRFTAKLMQLADEPAGRWLPECKCDHPCHSLHERVGAVFDAFALCSTATQ